MGPEFNALLLIFITRAGASPTTTQCPQFVAEGGNLICECKASSSPSNTVSWPRHSSGSTLTVSSVTRTMNGTRYACHERTAGGTAAGTVTYILRVAYGPDSGRTTVYQEPSPFFIDGTSSVKLTCFSDVYPEAEYSWKYRADDRRRSCVEGITTKNTCTFIPDRSDLGKTVACTLNNSYTNQIDLALFTLKIQIPGQDGTLTCPSTWNHGTTVQLTCTVRKQRITDVCALPINETLFVKDGNTQCTIGPTLYSTCIQASESHPSGEPCWCQQNSTDYIFQYSFTADIAKHNGTWTCSKGCLDITRLPIPMNITNCPNVRVQIAQGEPVEAKTTMATVTGQWSSKAPQDQGRAYFARVEKLFLLAAILLGLLSISYLSS